MIASNLYRYDINAARSVLKDTIYRIKVEKKKIGTNSYKDLLAQAYLQLSTNTEKQLSEIRIDEETRNPSISLGRKLNLFSKLMKDLNQVIETGSPEWSAKARYIGAMILKISELMYVSLWKKIIE